MAWVNFRRLCARTAGVAFCIFQYGCVAHCATEYVADFVICSGPSMEPTLYSNDVIVTEHITPRLQKLERGDIIVARSATNPHQHICKRITGLPGDKIKTGYSQEYVPMGHVWVEGDNRYNSTDSRDYGAIPQALVRGRAVCKIWPPNSVQLLTSSPKS